MTTYTGTPPTFAGLDNATVVANLNLFRDALKALSQAPTAYVPSYAGISAIGNAVVTAQYQRVDKWITGDVNIVMGSGTTFAATTFLIGLPVAAQAGLATNHCVGAGFLLDNSAGSTSRTNCHAITASSTTVFLVPGGSPGGTVTNLVPFTWAVNDTLSFQFRYPAA